MARLPITKQGGVKKIVICDTGMHHLIRPTRYEAWQFIWPTNLSPEHVPTQRAKVLTLPGLERSEGVGPICETGDDLAKDRPRPPVKRGELLAVFSAGA